MYLFVLGFSLNASWGEEGNISWQPDAIYSPSPLGTQGSVVIIISCIALIHAFSLCRLQCPFGNMKRLIYFHLFFLFLNFPLGREVTDF